ncbi:uncharacterized protein [Littorina saxatilis]|uniref:uncharacterized protein n=1 Tax=Littorina saxatilis TaxID=31220 RepID=UPI0038B57A1C
MAADDRFQRLRDSINATIGARTTELRRDNITMMERASAFRQQPGQTMPRMQRTRMWFVHVTGVPVGDTHLRTHSIKIFGEQGLGKANNGNTCCFSPTMSASDFEVKLRDLLPGLGRGEFDLLINRSQRLHSLNGRNPSALKAEFGRSRSALYCRPKGRDPNQAHQPADRPHSEEPHLQITVC